MAEIIQKTNKKTIYREGKTLVKLFNDESERGMGDHSGLRGRQDDAAADG